MKKKNGFISTTVVYTFFFVFLMILLFIINRYATNRNLLKSMKEDIKESFLYIDYCGDTYLACKIAKTVDTDSTLYYHDKNLENGANDGSYRYSGGSDDVNNYVCYGSDEETCPVDNLYRVIGVFGDQVKLIKSDYATSEQLGTDGDYYASSVPNATDSNFSHYKGSLATTGNYYWNKINYSTAKEETGYYNVWSYTELNKTNLNKNYITYLNNINSKWANMISTTTWHVSGGSTRNMAITSTAKTTYDFELGSNKLLSFYEQTYDAKIGLMYVSDYYFAANPTYWTYPGIAKEEWPDTNGNYGESYDYRAATDSNWMYMGLFEHTISRNSVSTDFVYALDKSGYMGWWIIPTALNVRPVFYLNDSVKYVSGAGTLTDPFRVSL